MAWQFYSLQSLPRPLDIVWCHFPTNELPNKPGPKPRPGLIRSILLNKTQTRAMVEVTYGTSKKAPSDYPLELHIANLAEMNAANLPQATCFVLGRTAVLPWAFEFFTRRDDGTGPVIGKLPTTAMMQLETLKVLRRQVGMD